MTPAMRDENLIACALSGQVDESQISAHIAAGELSPDDLVPETPPPAACMGVQINF